MTKRNLIIVIILLSVIDIVAAGWYMSRRIETGDKSDPLFDWSDSAQVITQADTLVSTSEPDEFDKLQQHSYYYIANAPAVSGDKTTCYTSIKHVKVQWPLKVNGDQELETLNKELISKAFGNNRSRLKEGRYIYLSKPSFNKPMGDDYHSLTSAPAIVPVYGNVSQVLVYPYMTSSRLLVMQVDKVEYNGHTTIQDNLFIHYDRASHHILSRIDILNADIANENKLLKLINKKIDNMNRSRGDSNHLQHALNVPAELCCGKSGILFQFKHGSISTGPIQVMIDYDDLEPYLNDGFKQLLKNNDAYHVFNDNIKPEPVNLQQHSQSVTTNNTVNDKRNSSISTSQHKRYRNKYRYNRYHNSKRSYYRNSRSRYHSKDSNSGKSNLYNAAASNLKQGYKSRKHYTGAKRRAARHGYSGRRHWNRRQR